MKKDGTKRDPKAKSETTPHRFRVPGFVTDQDIGLGEVIRRATYAMRIKPCSACERRAAELSHWMVFTGRRRS